MARTRALDPRSARVLALGWLVAEVVIGVVATVLGAARGRSWVAFVAAVGVFAAVAFYLKVRRWYELEGDRGPSEDFVRWSRRALPIMYATGIPCWIAIGIAAAGH